MADQSLASTYNFRHQGPFSAYRDEAGPDFWMFKGVDLKGKYPGISDNASDGTGKFKFNFGQKAFLGDPLGYAPYDSNFNKSLLSGKFHFEQEVMVPGNLQMIKYMKTYNSGQYYFEASIVQASISDRIGFASYDAATFCVSDGTISLIRMGRQIKNVQKCIINKNEIRFEWTEAENIDTGDTVQVWVDFDKGNLLIKKLGTTKEDYVNIE